MTMTMTMTTMTNVDLRERAAGVEHSRTGALPAMPAAVERARRGDRDAFATLYRSRFEAIARYVRAIVGNAAQAEDAVSETFLQAWRDLPKLREPERFDAWLYRIAHRRALGEIAQRRTAQPLEEAESIPDERRERSPQAALDAATEIERVRGALLDLSDSHREVLVLRHLLDRSYREIAEQLGKSEEAVRAMHVRAARELRRRVAPA
jgi:RNA polymerase sigma-70 factor (ECF subfamily)